MFEKGILGLLYRRLVLTTKHSIQGIDSTLRTQEAFRCEMLASVILIPLAFYVANDYLQLILLINLNLESKILFLKYIKEILQLHLRRPRYSKLLLENLDLAHQEQCK